MRQLLAIALLTALGSTASADPEVYIELAHGQLETTLVGAARLPATGFTLRDETDPGAGVIHATAVHAFADGPDAVALAIVYNGQEVWIGNDAFETDDMARYFGAFGGVADLLKELHAVRFPAGSQAALIAYNTGAAVRTPMGPIANLTDVSLGTQLDYRNKIGTDLVSGVELAMHELEQSRAPIKALLVLGDGNDTNNEAARVELLDLKKRAAKDHIQTFSIIYKGALSEPGSVIQTMIPASHTVNSFDGIAASAHSFFARITDRLYLTFSAEELKWDGREHALVLRAGTDDLDTVYVALPAIVAHVPWYRTGWWLQLFAGFGVIGLIALGMRLTRARAVI